MPLQVAERIRDLPNYPFVAINAQVRQLQEAGRKIYNMNMGSPDLPPPAWVVEALSTAAHNPHKHGYAGYQGLPAFRQAVARYYQKLFGVELDPEKEVLPLLGSKEGLVNMTLALVGSGDAVLIPNPAYPAYEMAARLAGGEPYLFPLLESENYLPNLDRLPVEVAERAKILWANYPHNPTGVVASLEDYGRMLDYCRQHDILLMSDNPYFAVTFDGSPPVSALQAPGAKERVVEFMSLSKSHNMAGWRLGAAVGNAEAIAALLKVKSNMDSGHFAAVYEAGVAALEQTPQDWIDERNQVYWRRAQILMEALPQAGLSVPLPPKGGIYLWAKVANGDDVGYCQAALMATGVSMVPGSIYGEVGQGYIRLSLMVPEAELGGVTESLKAWWATQA
jgi:LL-diaminopimelate aminotransferase